MPNTMHSFESNSCNVPAFLIKLWKLVEDPSCNDLIAWTDTGSSFIIRDQTRFSKDLLPQYFKHNNMASFIRQLNMYGFRKILNYEKSGLRNESDEMEFHHSFFCKGKAELLGLIKRKIPNAKIAEPPIRSNPKDFLTDISYIREKQENMDNMLLKMKQENELLWRELTSMRQKHKSQEQIIQKVIQFLVSIVHRTNQNIGVKRKLARMLQGIPANKGKSQVIDVLRNKNTNFITVPQDKLSSPLGPVIHEVTEFDHEQEVCTLSPTINSPEDGTESIIASESENQESECPLNSSLNSPINTSVATVESLNILSPLQSSATDLHADDSNPSESVLGLPLDSIWVPSSDDIAISEEYSDNVISLPDSSDHGLSYNIAPSGMLMLTSPKSDYDDLLMSESLQTPKIPIIHIDDPIIHTSEPGEENTASEKASINNNSSGQLNEHNYQLAISDSSKAVMPTTINKNTLSNHMLNMEEELKKFEDFLHSDDAFKILEMCEEYESIANNEDLAGEIAIFSDDNITNNETLMKLAINETGTGDIGAKIKVEPTDDIGNGGIQFTPSMLDCGLDMENHQLFLQSLVVQDAMSPAGDNKSTEDQKNIFLVDVLNADQKADSEAADSLLSRSIPKHKTPGHSKVQKLEKAKRQKIK